MPENNSEAYTTALEGKVIKSVEHHFYGDVILHFTDGTRFAFTPSGQPSTIFIKEMLRHPEPLMARVFKGE